MVTRSEIFYNPFTTLSNLSDDQSNHLARGIENDFVRITSEIFNEKTKDVEVKTLGKDGVIGIKNYFNNSLFRTISDIFKALESLNKKELAVQLMGDINLMEEKTLFNSNIYDLIKPSYRTFSKKIVMNFKINVPPMVAQSIATTPFCQSLPQWLGKCNVIDFICAFSEETKYIEELQEYLILHVSIPKKEISDFIENALNPIHYITDVEDLKGDFYGISEKILDDKMEKWISLKEFKEVFFSGKKNFSKNLENDTFYLFIHRLKNSFPILKIKFLKKEFDFENFSQVTLRMLLIALKKSGSLDCISLIKDRIESKKSILLEEEIISTPLINLWKFENHPTKHLSKEIQDFLSEYKIEPQFFVEEYCKQIKREVLQDQNSINMILEENSLTFGELKEIALTCLRKKMETTLEKIITL